MTPRSNYLELIVACVFFILLCAVGILWSISSGLLVSGIDGIMLVFVCLLMAGIFSLMIFLLLIQARILPQFGHSKSKAVAAPAPKPAAQPSPQGK